MATLKGKGVVWAVDGVTVTGVVADTNLMQSVDFTYASEKEELRDGTGEPKGLAYYNPTKSITLSVVPASTTIALAKTAMDGMLIAPGTGVIFVDTASAVTDVVNSGADSKYICEQSRLRRTNTGAAVVEMDLIQYGTDLSETKT